MAAESEQISFRVKLFKCQAFHVPTRSFGRCDPFLVFNFGGRTLQTEVVREKDPSWPDFEHQFVLSVEGTNLKTTNLRVECWDANLSDSVGFLELDYHSLATCPAHQSHYLSELKGKKVKKLKTRVEFELNFEAISTTTMKLERLAILNLPSLAPQKNNTFLISFLKDPLATKMMVHRQSSVFYDSTQPFWMEPEGMTYSVHGSLFDLMKKKIVLEVYNTLPEKFMGGCEIWIEHYVSYGRTRINFRQPLLPKKTFQIEGTIVFESIPIYAQMVGGLVKDEKVTGSLLLPQVPLPSAGFDIDLSHPHYPGYDPQLRDRVEELREDVSPASLKKMSSFLSLKLNDILARYGEKKIREMNLHPMSGCTYPESGFSTLAALLDASKFRNMQHMDNRLAYGALLSLLRPAAKEKKEFEDLFSVCVGVVEELFRDFMCWASEMTYLLEGNVTFLRLLSSKYVGRISQHDMVRLCNLLSSLCRVRSGNQQQIIQHKGVSILCGVLSSAAFDVEVKSATLSLLKYLCYPWDCPLNAGEEKEKREQLGVVLPYIADLISKDDNRKEMGQLKKLCWELMEILLVSQKNELQLIPLLPLLLREASPSSANIVLKACEKSSNETVLGIIKQIGLGQTLYLLPNEKIQLQFLSALTDFSEYLRSRTGTFEDVLSILRHGNDVIRKSILQALNKVEWDILLASKMCASDGVPILVQLAEKSHDPEMKSLAISLLFSLAQHDVAEYFATLSVGGVLNCVLACPPHDQNFGKLLENSLELTLVLLRQNEAQRAVLMEQQFFVLITLSQLFETAQKFQCFGTFLRVLREMWALKQQGEIDQELLSEIGKNIIQVISEKTKHAQICFSILSLMSENRELHPFLVKNEENILGNIALQANLLEGNRDLLMEASSEPILKFYGYQWGSSCPSTPTPLTRCSECGTQICQFCVASCHGKHRVDVPINVTNICECGFTNPKCLCLRLQKEIKGGKKEMKKEEVIEEEEEEEEEEEVVAEEECIVCWADPKNCVFYRCGHLSTCFDCGQELLSGGQPCPVCRDPLVDVVLLLTE